jgi:hypothetical protein
MWLITFIASSWRGYNTVTGCRFCCFEDLQLTAYSLQPCIQFFYNIYFWYNIYTQIGVKNANPVPTS